MRINGFTGHTSCFAFYLMWGSVLCCCVIFFFLSSLYPLCSQIAQLLVDRAISYPPELGNTMVSLCSKTLQFNTKDKKVSAICLQCNSSLHSSESESQDWSQGRFRSGSRIPTEAPRRSFQKPFCAHF